MENNNINTNVAQIILPPDMELRKVKKKKPKTSSEKKKALKKLKDTLKAYDTVLALASSKKITIPAELGMLPDDLSEINTIKKLKVLTDTLLARIQTINQLIAQGVQQGRTTGLFSEGTGTGGRIPQGSAPYQPPQRQPEILPNTGMFPSPAPPIIPSGSGGVDPTQVPDGAATKTLQELREEILNKLSPEDRATAEAELEQERKAQQSPDIPQTPTTPTGSGDLPPGSPNIGFETLTNFDIGGGKTETITAPIGWGDIYDQYRQYMEGLTQKLVKMDKGIFELPAIVEDQLNQTRNDLLQQHDQLLKSLNINQQTAMDADASLSQLDKGMINELTLDPKDVIKQIAKSQNIQLKQITSGITKTEEGLQGQRTEAAKKLLTQLEVAENDKDRIIEDVNKSKKTNNIAEIKLQAKAVQDTVNSLRALYDKLSGVEQASIEFEYQSFLKKMMALEVAIQRLENENLILDPEGNPIEPVAPPPEEPPIIVQPPEAPAAPAAGTPIDPVQAGTQLKTGKFVRIKVSQRMKGVLGKLDLFASKPNSLFTQNRYEEILEVMESDKLEPLIDRNQLRNGFSRLPPADQSKARNQAARVLVKEQILDRVLVDTLPV